MIDYKVGDWVETCNLMPAICEKIDKKNDDVEVFYPHLKEADKRYNGGSCCSIKHCGVHKIDESLAKMMLKLGVQEITEIYCLVCNEGFDNDLYHNKIIEKYHEKFGY